MLKRIFVGALLIGFTVGVFLLDAHLERAAQPKIPTEAGTVAVKALPIAMVLLVLIAAGYLEFARMAAGVGVQIPRMSGMLAAMLVGTWPFWRQLTGNVSADGMELLILLGLAVMAAFAAQLVRFRTVDAIRRIGATLLAVCYLGVCAAVVLEIRMRFGVATFLLFLLVIKFTDIGAYFTGTAIGRHKILPWLSPGKSWEGLAGGLALAAGGGIAFASLLVGPFLTEARGLAMGLPAVAAFAVVVGAFGQAADMCESALKRDAGMKDAGRSVPGFGGILDVIDSPLLAGPAALILLGWLA